MICENFWIILVLTSKKIITCKFLKVSQLSYYFNIYNYDSFYPRHNFTKYLLKYVCFLPRDDFKGMKNFKKSILQIEAVNNVHNCIIY